MKTNETNNNLIININIYEIKRLILLKKKNKENLMIVIKILILRKVQILSAYIIV